MILKLRLVGALLVFNLSLLLSQNVDKQEFGVGFRFKNSTFSIEDEKYLSLKNGDSVLVEALRFYISNLTFLQNGVTVAKDNNMAHLIDAVDANSLRFLVDLPKKTSCNQIKFNLGIDSLTNVSGAMGGDLDPMKGMFWTWQSGYINFKLEGKNPRCKTRNNEFQLHLGGYAYPHNTLQNIVLDIEENKIVFDLSTFLNEVDFVQKPNIMSPCKEAVELSKKAAKGFSGIGFRQ